MSKEQWRGFLPEESIKVASGPIYHYTDPSSLIGLVENRELWATEAAGMNDLGEVRQGWDFIKEWVTHQRPDQIVEAIEEACEAGHPANDVDGVFMCCASTRGDDANQWRLYASGGRGYAVELDAGSALAALAPQDKAPKDRSTSGRSAAGRIFHTLGNTASVSPWIHVLYTDEEKRAALDGLLENARSAWERMKQRGFDGQEDFDIRSQEFRGSLMTDVARAAQLMKSEGFAGENEVRVIATAYFGLVSRFRPTSSGVVRYVRLTGAPADQLRDALVYRCELGDDMHVPVTSVRIGPLINAQNNERTIRALLNRNRLRDAHVESSDVPLSLDPLAVWLLRAGRESRMLL